jgi:hypothetical protein
LRADGTKDKLLSGPSSTSLIAAQGRRLNSTDREDGISLSVPPPSSSLPPSSSSPSLRSSSLLFSFSSFHPHNDNETLQRIRIKRLEGQLQELQLKTQLELQYKRAEWKKPHDKFQLKMEQKRTIDNDPVQALTIHRVDYVKHLQNQNISLVAQKRQLDEAIVTAIAEGTTLVQESQRHGMLSMMVLVNEIQVAQRKYARLVTFLETLSILQQEFAMHIASYKE